MARHIVIFPLGSAGDVHPFIGLARALQARGNEVVIATSSYFEDAVRKAEVSFESIGTRQDFEDRISDPDLWHPSRAFKAVMHRGVEPTYQPMLDVARKLHRPGETVIVGSTLALGARTAAEVLGAPFVSVHLAPSVFLSVDEPPVFPGMIAGPRVPRWLTRLQLWIGRRLTDRVARPGLNKFRKSLGLPPVREIIRDWWHAPGLTLGLFPDWFGAKQADWPAQTRLTGFPLFDESGQHEVDTELQAFLGQGDAPVIFTPGSAMAHGTQFFAEAVKACLLLGRRGLLLTKFRETIPASLPPEVRHFAYVPFSEVMPRCSALVSHGGIGTCAQAMRAGIPHLVQYMAYDQPDNAARLRRLGVGDGIAATKFRAPAVAARLSALLDSEQVRQRCREVAAKFTPEAWQRQSCEWIEQAGR